MVLSRLLGSASLEEWSELLRQREDAEAQDGSRGKQAALVVIAVTRAAERQENSWKIPERGHGREDGQQKQRDTEEWQSRRNKREGRKPRLRKTEGCGKPEKRNMSLGIWRSAKELKSLGPRITENLCWEL